MVQYLNTKDKTDVKQAALSSLKMLNNQLQNVIFTLTLSCGAHSIIKWSPIAATLQERQSLV